MGARPKLCWVDDRMSTNLSAPRTPGLLLEWRQVPDTRGQPRWEGLVVSAKPTHDGGWTMSTSWVRAGYIVQLDPLNDRELEDLRLGH